MCGETFVNDENIKVMIEACNVIDDAGGCHRCPLYDCCLDVTSFKTIGEVLTEDMVDDFLRYSDHIEHPAITEDDIIADYADMARKAERDEYYD